MSNINDEINNIVLDADNVSSFDSDNEIEFVMAEKARRAFATITSFLIFGFLLRTMRRQCLCRNIR